MTQTRHAQPELTRLQYPSKADISAWPAYSLTDPKQTSLDEIFIPARANYRA
jgi:hypothetical protein